MALRSKFYACFFCTNVHFTENLFENAEMILDRTGPNPLLGKVPRSSIMPSNRSTRRKFLQQSGGALAGATLAGAISQRAYAGEDNTIKIALVGCGGRGNGAVNEALQTAGPTKLVA